VTAVSVGDEGSSEFDSRFTDDHFEVLLPASSEVRRNAAEFAHWVAARGIDVVFCTGRMFTIAAAPALPSHVRLITRCGAMTRRGYDLATANLPRIDRIVVETPRQRRDLTGRWRVPLEKCVIIPGGIEVASYSPGATRDFKERLRLLYLGRLEEASKGVMLLPQIAARLLDSGLDFHLDIIGDGPDRDRLRDAFSPARLNPRVTFHGFLRREQTLSLLQRAHVSLLPSRYEGVSWALLETMACGCVPVASWIAGATDYVVNHGTNGLLCTVGKVSHFAQAVLDLAADRNRLKRLSSAASQTICERFTVERVISAHDDLLKAVLAERSSLWRPIPASEIQTPKLSAPNWRRFVPQPVKNCLRTWAERFHRPV
jgi:glycosyltransferase involved in cell wall biosynthesis